MRLADIATHLGCQLAGDPDTEITGLATIETAAPGQLSFLSNLKYRRFLSSTRASAMIVDDSSLLPPGVAGLIATHPYLAFAQALALFVQPLDVPAGIHPTAVVAPSAVLGPEVAIGPFTSIGERAQIGAGTVILSHCSIYADVRIGEQCLIHSHCVIREGCSLGERVVLQNNVVIGSDGFGFAGRPDNSWQKIPQGGAVVIEDDVEIGSGSVIDRASIGVTRIGKGSKIDNLVQVGHGSTVGEHTLLCAQVGLAGSTHVGNHVILGGQVGAAGHLRIGDNVTATAQTGIPNSVAAGQTISGYPAIENRKWLKASAVFAQLPELRREIRELKERLARILEQPRNTH
jgi:UDP-3-O-[3-hydroxymyristoyl] glucosamine N-acyltransferase